MSQQTDGCIEYTISIYNCVPKLCVTYSFSYLIIWGENILYAASEFWSPYSVYKYFTISKKIFFFHANTFQMLKMIHCSDARFFLQAHRMSDLFLISEINRREPVIKQCFIYLFLFILLNYYLKKNIYVYYHHMSHFTSGLKHTAGLTVRPWNIKIDNKMSVQYVWL